MVSDGNTVSAGSGPYAVVVAVVVPHQIQWLNLASAAGRLLIEVRRICTEDERSLVRAEERHDHHPI